MENTNKRKHLPITNKFFKIELKINSNLTKMNRVNNKLQISNTYFPNYSSSFRLMQIDNYRQNRENEESKIWDESEDDLMAAGVANGWKRNRTYLELIDKWDLINLSNQDILSRFKAWLLGWAEKKNYHKTISFKYDELTKRVHPKIKNIVIRKYYEKWTIKQLSSAFNLNDVVWRAII